MPAKTTKPTKPCACEQPTTAKINEARQVKAAARFQPVAPKKKGKG